MNLKKLFSQYMDTAMKGDRVHSRQLIEEAINAGTPAIDIYYHVFYPTMVQTGVLWQKNEISVAQEHMITAMTQNTIASLYPLLFKDLANRETERGSILVACPGDELHELGIRMLADVWELEGWDVTYLGANIPAHFIIDQLTSAESDILALSCAISFNLRFVKETIDAARAAAFKGPVIVGGRVFNVDSSLKDYVGADYYGSDFYEAVKILDQCKLKRNAH